MCSNNAILEINAVADIVCGSIEPAHGTEAAETGATYFNPNGSQSALRAVV